MRVSGQRPPWWFICILALFVFPLAAWPAMVSAISGNMEPGGGILHLLVLVFPVYTVLSVYCAYRCFLQQRYLSWILLFLLLASYLSVGSMACF